MQSFTVQSHLPGVYGSSTIRPHVDGAHMTGLCAHQPPCTLHCRVFGTVPFAGDYQAAVPYFQRKLSGVRPLYHHTPIWLIRSLMIHCLIRWLSQGRHNERGGVCSKKTSKLRVTGLCGGNSPVTGEFPAQMASNAENASIWWRHHATRGAGHRDRYIRYWWLEC